MRPSARSPWPTVSVAHSPTPSAVRIAARRVGAVRKAAAACAFVVPREEDLASWNAEVRRDDAANPDFFAERVLHGVRERSPGARESAQRAGEDPLELQHAALVEDDGVEIGRVEPGVIEAPFDRPDREGGVILSARQALLLYGADGHAIDEERGRRIVVMRRDPENLHLNTGSSATRCVVRARSAPSPGCSRRAARLANQAKGGSRTK